MSATDIIKKVKEIVEKEGGLTPDQQIDLTEEIFKLQDDIDLVFETINDVKVLDPADPEEEEELDEADLLIADIEARLADATVLKKYKKKVFVAAAAELGVEVKGTEKLHLAAIKEHLGIDSEETVRKER